MGATADTAVGSAPDAAVRFRVLGPVDVVGSSGQPLPLGPPRQRALLAALLVHPTTALSVDRLTELLWDGAPPPTAATMVHGAVAGLRQSLEPGRGRTAPRLLASRDRGYTLDVHPGQVDVAEFEGLLTRGHRLLDAAPAQASGLFAEALSLWRGPALSGIEQAFARDAARRWEELRLECSEARLAAELVLGNHTGVVAELADLVARHPFRERLSAQLIVALYRCGRQAEALEASRTLRRMLAAELGVEPGPEVQRLEQSVLRHSEDLAAPVRSALRNGLPTSFSTFVGRAQECEEVAELLESHRLVTLTGPGGSGKTRLAVEVARHLVDDGTTEARLVDLAPLTNPALVDEAIAGALGVRLGSGRELADAAATALAGRHVTIVLDNCEHLVDTCALLVESLLAAAPGVRVLTTTREALHVPGEQVHVVQPLSTAVEADGWEHIAACDAVRLFTQRASSARPGWAVTRDNAGLVLRICRRLDGLPLALELAGARAASLPLGDLAERLDDRFRLLDPGGASRGGRRHSLAATIAWSHDLLSAPERMLFARTSVFPAGFGRAAAEDVARGGGLDDRDVGLLLARLVSCSTVQMEDDADGEPRYRLLESTRQYGRERLDERSLAALQARHAHHYLELAQLAEPHLLREGAGPWLTRLHTEEDNFRAALEWSFGPDGDPALGARLVGCLWHPWDLRGARGEGLHWVRAGLEATGPHLPTERLGLLSAGALFHLGRAEFAAAADLTREQLTLARTAGARGWEGDAMASEATMAWARGEFDHAQQLYEDAVAASLDGGDVWRASLEEAQLARLHRDRGEPDAARAAGCRARDHAEHLGEELARGLALDVLSSVEQRWGDPATARRLIDQALTHYRHVGYLEGEASASCGAGRGALRAHDLGPARDAFEHSLSLCRRIGHRGGSATALEGLAEVAAAADDDEWAVLLLGAAAALREQIGTPLTGVATAQHLRVRRRLIDRLGPDLADRTLRRGADLPLDALLDGGRDRFVGS
jgi:predicted ATPase/DNA-binding SARP family transcriptional activator